MKKFKSQWNYVPTEGRIMEDAPITIPNQALTVKELQRRIQAGLALPKLNFEYDYNETGLPQFRIRDLTDLDRARNYIEDFKRRLNERKKAVEVARKTKDAAAMKPAKAEKNEA